MIHALSICLPLTVAVVLVASGIAKLRHPDDLSGWARIGVPEPLRRGWLVLLHPWGEIVLGVLVAALGGWAGAVAGVLAAALMAVYTVLIAGVLKRPEAASCACFGERKQVTRATLLRNIWLLILAAGAVCVIWGTPLLGGAVAETVQSSAWGWVMGLAVVGVTTWLVTRQEPARQERAAQAGAPAVEDDDALDYVRTFTPAVPVTLADGTVRTLRELSGLRPLMLLNVSPTCGACHSVIAKVDVYRALLPEVEVRLLLDRAPADTDLTEATEPQSLHDPYGYVPESFAGMWGTPSALLFGTDGMLAGGPVVGADGVDAFVDQVRAELDS